MSTVTAKPEGLTRYEALLSRRKAAKTAGRLWRIKHPSLGHGLLEAKDEAEAVAKFAGEKSPAESRNKEWLTRFSAECRIAKVQ
jgi:hypothetical protein